MKSESGDDTVFVSLKPFLHQVGGHGCMFQITPGVVCKPKRDREMEFYLSLPASLQPCVPICHGLTEVRCHKSDNGLLFYAEIPKHVLSMPCMKDVQLFTLDRKSDENNDDVKRNRDDGKGGIKRGLDNWCNQQVQLHLTKYGYWSDPEISHTFIMLGNLLESYKLPCVLDIKMGTKQYSDKTNLAKMKKQDEICAFSTSSKIGFRLSGFQVYKSNTREYVTKDKFHGRTLDVPGVHRELMNFFHDGFCLRTKIIKSLLLNLYNVHDAIAQQDSQYFFSSSLLLIYDCPDTYDKEKFSNQVCSCSNGYSGRQRQCCESMNTVSTDVRLIDFGQTFFEGNRPEYNSGFLFGLKNLIDILKEIISE